MQQLPANAATPGYSLSVAGTPVSGTVQPAARVSIVTTSPAALRSVRLYGPHDAFFGRTTTFARDALGRWTAEQTVDLAPYAGTTVSLRAWVGLSTGLVVPVDATFSVARRGAAPTPSSPTATPTAGPTSSSSPTPTASPTASPTTSPTTSAPAPTASPTTTASPTASPTGTTVPRPAPSSPSPTVSPTPPAPTASPSPSGPSVSPMSFGAVGNGVADDTAALRRTLAALKPGDTLTIPAGRVFRHTDVLRLQTPRVTVSGGGTLLATNENASAFFVQADGATLQDVSFRLTGSTRRLGTWDQMKVTVLKADDVTVRRVTIDGSAAAGLYFWGSQRFSVSDVQIGNTRADGLHITGPSSDGSVARVTITNSGDDGVAVVSYQQDGVPVRRVSIDSPTVLGTTWGRGVSVVGGEDIAITNVRIERSACAAIYIAKEGEPWNTFAPRRVQVSGGTIVGANTMSSVDHGAVLVYDGRAGGGTLGDVSLSGLTIRDTRSSASRQVGYLRSPGGDGGGVRFTGFTITGGPANLLSVTAPSGTWSATGWTYGGTSVPNRS